jgi:hypothetical protein
MKLEKGNFSDCINHLSPSKPKPTKLILKITIHSEVNCKNGFYNRIKHKFFGIFNHLCAVIEKKDLGTRNWDLPEKNKSAC